MFIFMSVSEKMLIYEPPSASLILIAVRTISPLVFYFIVYALGSDIPTTQMSPLSLKVYLR